MSRVKLRQLLRDYSFEEILEAGDLEEIDALEYLVEGGALILDSIVMAIDGESDAEAEEQE